MSTKIVLRTIGILGIAASIYGFIQDKSITNNLITFICGVSLLVGYWEPKQKS